MELRIKKHDSFFPARRCAECPASAAMLTFAVCCSYLLHFYIVYSFHSVFYLRLISPFIYLKAIRTLYIRKVHSLLSNYRPNYNIIVVHDNIRISLQITNFRLSFLSPGQIKKPLW